MRDHAIEALTSAFHCVECACQREGSQKIDYATLDHALTDISLFGTDELVSDAKDLKSIIARRITSSGDHGRVNVDSLVLKLRNNIRKELGFPSPKTVPFGLATMRNGNAMTTHRDNDNNLNPS